MVDFFLDMKKEETEQFGQQIQGHRHGGVNMQIPNEVHADVTAQRGLLCPF